MGSRYLPRKATIRRRAILDHRREPLFSLDQDKVTDKAADLWREILVGQQLRIYRLWHHCLLSGGNSGAEAKLHPGGRIELERGRLAVADLGDFVARRLLGSANREQYDRALLSP